MLRLARPFSDGMVLQRQMPITIWGNSDETQIAAVCLNGKQIAEAQILPGTFSITLPPLDAQENAILEIGDVTLRNVDIGEVWIAGGQSNMEFFLAYTADGDREIKQANDLHLRMYTMGQYSFAGEREMGYKAWNPWDQWLCYTPDNAGSFSAVAVYFAKALRRRGIPVGIVSCNWGGTSATAWTESQRLAESPRLKTYLDDFAALTDALDLERYRAIKAIVRPSMASKETREQIGVFNRYTFRPGELEKKLGMHASKEQSAEAQTDNPLAGITIEEIMAVGPGEPNEPGALFENMVKEIAGYAVKGVIWYQGETDDKKANLYCELFATMVSNWRNAWLERNPAQKKLPFLTVQLAPFGVWRNDSGVRFPILRQQQEQAAKTVSDVYMTSISDLGNVFDIHPKVKQPVGERLALLAEKYLYGESALLADAPEASGIVRIDGGVSVSFVAGEGLTLCAEPFDQYNGFSVQEIPNNILPPVLGGVNGLYVTADGEALTEASCETERDSLLIRAPKLENATAIRVEFAQTGFYKVNLFNAAGIPAKPFISEIGGKVK